MDNLPTVIGKAPSEMTLGEFKAKLSAERDRVRRGLEHWKNVVFSKGKGKKASQATKLSALLAEAGLSPQDMVKGIAMLKKLEEEKDG